MRTFEDKPATRERVPLLVGICGSSGSGKTFSALRLATGIQSVVGGEIGCVDTEARRALWYADRFKFNHLDFKAPFGPLDYLAAVQHFAAKGCKVIVIDSQSHAHEGPGGVLEMHEQEVQRLAQAWKSTPDKVTFAAWQKPKAELRRYINEVLQMPINFIFTVRAKEKMRPVPGKQPVPLGFMPVIGDEFIYEMSLNVLLYPGSGGVPSWHPEELGEKAIVKLPAQFEPVFREKKPLDEETGSRLAEWAIGGSPVTATPDRAATLTEIKSVLKESFPGKSKAVFQEVFGAPFEKEASVPPDRLLAGLQALKSRAAAQTTPQPEIVAPGPVSGQFSGVQDDTRSTASTIWQAAESAGLSEERLLAICKGDPEEVPDSPEILEEILSKIGKETA